MVTQSKVNIFFSEKPQVPGVACLVIKYGEKVYNLLDESFENEDIVVKERKEIEEQLRLNDLSKYFSKLGVFLRIARCAVRKYPDLQKKVRTNHMSTYDLCDETAHLLNEFQRNTDNAMQNLQTAYLLVKKSEEKQASNILRKLQKMSQNMKEKADKLSKKCKDQSEIIRELGNEIVEKHGKIMNEEVNGESEMEDLSKEIQQIYKDKQFLLSQKQKTQSDLQSNLNKRGETIEELTKSNKYNQNKNVSIKENILECNNYNMIDELELKATNQKYEILEQFIRCMKKERTHMIALGSLEVALKALDHIDFIMTKIGYFWEEIQGWCTSIMTNGMEFQVERLSDLDSQQCKIICQNDDSFWKDALKYYVKWFVLKEVCTTTSTRVKCISEVIEEYKIEDPNKEETFRDIQEMINILMKRLRVTDH